MKHVGWYLIFFPALIIGIKGEGRSAAPKLRIDPVPMFVVEGQPVSGGVRVLMSQTSTNTEEASFNGSKMQHAWTQTSDIDTTTQEFKELVTGTMSENFSETINGKGLLSASMGIKGDHSDSTTDLYDNIEIRKRDQEELQDSSINIINFNKKTSASTLSSDPNSGYARTGLHIRDYTNADAEFSVITDELDQVDLITGKSTGESFSFHNPVRTTDSGGHTDPTGPIAITPPPATPFKVIAPASVAQHFGHLEIPLYYEGLNAFQAKMAFNSYNMFRERITNYTLKWQGHTYSKSQVDQQIQDAKVHDIQIRIINSQLQTDTIQFLKPLSISADLSLVDTVLASGHKLVLSQSQKDVVSVDGRQNSLDLLISSKDVHDSLDKGFWKVLRAHDGELPTEVNDTDLSSLKAKAGDVLILSFVTLKDILEEHLTLSTARFGVLRIDDVPGLTGGSGPWIAGMALWTNIQTAAKDFPLNRGKESKCLFTTDTNPLRVGDKINIKVRSAWRDLKSWPTNTLGTFFYSAYHLKQSDIGFFNAFIATEYELRGDTQIKPDITDPDDLGISVSFGANSPLLKLSTVINAGAGKFSETGDGTKLVNFSVTQSLIGSGGGPACLQFTSTVIKDVQHGRDYTEKDFSGGGQHPLVAAPIPQEVFKALFDWKAAYPLTKADFSAPQEWTVEVSKRSVPWQ